MTTEIIHSLVLKKSSAIRTVDTSAFVSIVVHLVVAFAQKLELLRLLVHEHAVQVTGLGGTDLDGLVAPAHDLARADERCKSAISIQRSKQTNSNVNIEDEEEKELSNESKSSTVRPLYHNLKTILCKAGARPL